MTKRTDEKKPALAGETLISKHNILFLLLLAAFLRAPTVNVQSFWLDEVYTVNVVRGGFVHLWEQVAATENTPPLYYLLTWLWGQLFGFGEAGLRMFSVLASVVTVAVIYQAVFVFTKRSTVALLAGFLTAVNPYLVWFAQEARAYSLAILFASLSLLAIANIFEKGFAFADQGESHGTVRRWLLLWGFFLCCLLLTSYYGFLIAAAQGTWLLLKLNTSQRRYFVGSLAALLVVTVGLLPLLYHQQAAGTYTIQRWGGSLPYRILQMPKQFAVGWDGPLQNVFGFVICVVFVAFLVGLRHTVVRERWYVQALGVLFIAVCVIPVLVSLVGPDTVLSRYYLVFWPFFVFLVALGGAHSTQNLLRFGVGCIAVLSIITICGVALSASYQRDNWRGFSRLLSVPQKNGAVVLSANTQQLMIQHYRPELLNLRGAQSVMIDHLILAQWKPQTPQTAVELPPELVPRFSLQRMYRSKDYVVASYRAVKPVPVSKTIFAGKYFLSRR